MSSPGGSIRDMYQGLDVVLKASSVALTGTVAALIKDLVIRCFTRYRQSYESVNWKEVVDSLGDTVPAARLYLALHAIQPRFVTPRLADAIAKGLESTAEDVRHRIRQTGQDVDTAGNVAATFIIEDAGWLHIADQRSEHVACAGGRPVRSAGEMTFTVRRGDVRVTWVTNQSTGYCPEPDSWPAVESALARAGIEIFGISTEFAEEASCGII